MTELVMLGDWYLTRSDVLAWKDDLVDSDISARNVTTQLFQDSTPCKNCDARRFVSDSELVMLGDWYLTKSDGLAW